MMTDDISIRSIQHWLYCPHRWGLLEIDCAWSENYYVTKANLLHKRVHETGTYYSKAKRSFTSVTIYNDLPEYRIYGIADCVEMTEGLYSIVEYKPTMPKEQKFNHDDLMQVFAQKICVDHVFNCNCDGYIYYADVKKRVKLPIKENYQEYNNELISVLSDMREYIKNGIVPQIKKGQKCGGCSMKDICMPGLKKHQNFESTVMELLESDR